MFGGGESSGGIKAPKTLKRRNFKKLSLNPVSPTTATNGTTMDRESTGASASSTSNTSASSTFNSNDNNGHSHITSQLASLELGVEFKLDLRMEDFSTISELGSGNGGTVTKVMHVPTQKIMAKKVIYIEGKPSVRKQIVRELHIMHECDFPNIVSFYGAFAAESSVTMCMEYMDCGSLDRIYKKYGPLPESIISQISVAVVDGLTYLYNEHRIIHRDVKPSNVLVNSSGQIKLCDFGVSGELINSIADTFVGTSTYMSPERIQGGAYTVKSDVWSLGITLLELAIGRFPFETHNSSLPVGILDLLQRIVNEPPPRLPEEGGQFSSLFRTFVDKCLYREEDRPSPQDLLGDDFYLRAKQANSAHELKQWAQSLVQ